MKKLILLLFFIIVLSIYGNNERYQIGEGVFQVGMNFGINSCNYNNNTTTKLSLLSNQDKIFLFFTNSSLEIGPKFGRFATDSGGLTLSYAISDKLNISLSSPILILSDDDDKTVKYIGGDTTLSIDYTIELIDIISIIINPTISKRFYNKISKYSGDDYNFDEKTAIIDYGFNLLLLYEENTIFADIIFGYHENRENRYNNTDDSDYDYLNYPETSQTTLGIYGGKILDESSRIKGGFIYNKAKISFNEVATDSVTFVKFEGVYSRKISKNSMIDLALSHTKYQYNDNSETIMGINAKLVMNF